MAQLWSLRKNNAEERWQAGALPAAGCAVAFDDAGGLLHLSPDETCSAAVLILSNTPPGARPRWNLLAGRDIRLRVNGRPLALGLRALQDKDEILLNGHRLFFSTEELARTVTFPGLAQPAFCPRCKQKIEPGDLAVCCPSCSAWSHQSEKFPCWTYDQTCGLCQQQSTALDAGFNFYPGKL